MKPVPFPRHIPAAPTNPADKSGKKAPFRIRDLFDDQTEGSEDKKASGLDEKLRQAYFWITNTAIISPFYDIEYHEQPPQSFFFGDSKVQVDLPTGQSYSSFVLIPLLTLAVRKRCLIVGGPGRGKTATSILMGLLAGYDLKDMKRAIQHGQPQMTVADLLGHPFPGDLMKSEDPSQIRISWRKWLGMRVKIIDEYNRIPTRTQSALLTVLADNYAEIMDQIYECPEAAWYLTANDDAGGGTYQVIEALKDRIDVVVRALHFNTRFLEDLQHRIETGFQPEKNIPGEIVFTEEELDTLYQEILAIRIPVLIRKKIEFFARQFEFFEPASTKLEYMTKDTAKLSGLDFQELMSQESGKDQIRDLGSQAKNGLSVRKLMTILLFTKALAYFRGHGEVEDEDVRQIIPFVLHDSLSPYLESPYFDSEENGPYRVDRITWIRKTYDLSCQEFERLKLQKHDPVEETEKLFRMGLEDLSIKEVEKRMFQIEQILKEMSKTQKLYGHMADDILKLKYFHQRYTNYRRWLQWK
ncbi:AAA family ATPase [Sediminispirochaeta bajacaliforniensis]|uniref:AAA family ATPase n=1 Tax=Sediminispirochaeta bajacaliforniensis TaxID=148 RepID=UPI0003749BDE|nr:AAA family ATPase [Sediminispirochaeta bajacaliforniensis]